MESQKKRKDKMTSLEATMLLLLTLKRQDLKKVKTTFYGLHTEPEPEP